MKKIYLCCASFFLFSLITPVSSLAQSWSLINSFGGPGRCNAISFVSGTKAYVGSGGDLLNSNALYQDLWEYDPGTGVWTQKANMPAIRTVATGFAIGQYGYVVGGKTSGSAIVNTVYQYNTLTNTWVTKNNFIGSRFGLVSFAIGNRAYVGMGYNGSTHFNDFYSYNPTTDSWTSIASFPGTAAREGMGFTIGATGLGYVGGGYNGSTFYNNFYEYNPVTNTWAAKANIPSGLCKAGAYSIGTIGYLNTGWTSAGSLRSTYAYNPSANTWSTLPDYPNNQVMEGIGFSINTKGYFGLGWQNTGVLAQVFAALTPSSALTASALSGTYYCPGSSLSVPYSSTGITFTSNTFTAQLSDANGQWSSPTNIGTLVSTSSSGTISCTLPAGASGAGYRIRVIASNPATTGGDNGTSLIIQRPVLTINPTTASQCSGSSTSIALTSDIEGATYTWTVATTAGITGATSCASSCATTIAQAISNSSNSTSGIATYTITPSLSGCTGTNGTSTITVQPTPQGSASAQSICSGVASSVTLNSTVTGTTFTWTAALLSGTASGFSNQTTGTTGPIAQTLTNTTASNAVVRYTVTPTANNCSGSSFTVDVTVKPLPTGSASGQTICSNITTSITPSSTVTSTTYTWTASLLSGTASGFSNQTVASTTIAQQLFNTTTTSAVVRYVITPTANGCNGSTFNADVTVNPRPTGNGLPQTICSGNSTSMALGSNVTGTSFTWTAALFSGTASGFSNQTTPSSGPIAQTLTNTTASAATVRYTITPTAASCAGSTFTLDAVVNPIPTAVVTPSTQNICSANTTSLALSSNLAGATFTWTASPASGLTGSSNCSSTCGTTIAQSITSSNNVSAAVSYSVIATVNNCNSTAAVATVNVLPRPTGSASPQSRCSGVATSVALNSTVTGTTFTWTAALVSGTATGFSDQTTSTSGPIIQTLINNSSSAAVVRYTITPTAGGCSGNTFTADVTVNPPPVLTTTPSSQNVCTGNACSVALSSNVTGTTYTWTVSQGAGITGASACSSACSTTISQTLSNSLLTTGQATYTITPSANGCSGASAQSVVNVIPRPTGNALPQTICSGQPSSITLNSNIASSVYTWTAALNSGTATGFSNVSTANNGPIAQTLTNSSATAAIVRYTITPLFQSCAGTTFTSDVTVQPQVVITVSPSQQVICNNTTSSLSYSSAVANTTFTYSAANADGAVVTGFSSQNTPGPAGIIAQTLSTSGNAGLVNYTISASANGCTATPVNTFIRVGSVPDTAITASGPLSFCNSSSVTLSVAPVVNAEIYANQQTAPYANSNEINCDCPPGYIAVGVQGNTGGLIDNFKLVCKDYNSQTGKLGTNIVYSTQNGLSNGGAPQTVVPGGDMVLTGGALQSDYYNLTYFTAYFKPLNSVLNKENNAASPFGSGTLNSTGNNIFNLGSEIAPNGYVVTGMKAKNTTYSSSVQWKFTALDKLNNTYLWNTGSTAGSITVSTTGNYNVTVTNAYGCSGQSAAKQVITGPVPAITASTALVCANTTKTLTASAGLTYLWSTGATTPSIQASPGQYVVTVNGCPSSSTEVYQYKTSAYIVTNDDTICSGSSAQIEAGIIQTDTIYLPYSAIFGTTIICNNYPYTMQNPFGLEWNDNSNRQITAAKIEFAVGHNCSASSMGATFNTTPIASFALPTNCVCQLASPGNLVSVNLPVAAYLTSGINRFYFGAYGVSVANDPVLNGYWGRVIVSYKDSSFNTQWSTGATTTAISVNTAGTFTATVTDRNNCVHSVSQTIQQIPSPAAPVITKNFTTYCPPVSVSATPANGNFVWSNGTTGNTSQYYNAGPFTVTITGANGCTAATTDNINNTIPGDTAVFGNQMWNVYVFNYGAANFAPQIWKSGYSGFFTAAALSFYSDNYYNSNQTPSDAPGYQGCVTGIDNHSWTAKRRGFDCGYYTLNVPAHDDAYELYVNGVRVGFHDGCCDSHSSVWQGYLDANSTIEFRVTEGGGGSIGKLEVVKEPLGIAVNGSTTLCGNESRTLSINTQIPGYSNYNLLWSNGSTASSINVNNTATLSASITLPGGCVVKSDTVLIFQYPIPIITPSVSGTLCGGQTNTLTAGSGNSFLWSTGATTASITINEARSYSVTVNGCLSQPYQQLMYPRTGQINLVQPTDDVCTGTPLNLRAEVYRADTLYLTTANFLNTLTQCNNVWSNWNVTTAGLRWSDNSATSPEKIRVEWSLGVSCANNNPTQLSLNGTNGGMYYPALYCGCNAPVGVINSVDFPGSVYRTDSVNTLVFQRTFSNEFGFTNINYQMQGGVARVIRFYKDSLSSVTWFNGATTRETTITTSGTYTATITDTAGCTSVANKTINMRPLPVANINKGWTNAFCSNGYLYAYAGQNMAYLWSTGSTSDVINISTPGIYSITITNTQTGCVNTDVDTVIGLLGDTADFGNNEWIVYGFGNGGPTINSSSWSYYRGFYRDTTLSFKTSNKWGVNSNPSTAPGYWGCTIFDDYHSWRAKRQGFPCGYYKIDVANHDDAAEVLVNGVKVMQHANGCCDAHPAIWTGFLDATSTIEFRATEGGGNSYGELNIIPLNLTINNTDTAKICNGAPVVLRPATTYAGLNYLWSNGSTADSIVATTTQMYSVTITTPYGCSNVTSIAVVNGTIPTITTNGNPYTCENVQRQLFASSGTKYVWNSGATTASILPLKSGVYTVTVDGCQSDPFKTISNSKIGYLSSNTKDTVCDNEVVYLKPEVLLIDTVYIYQDNLSGPFYQKCLLTTQATMSSQFGFNWIDNDALMADKVKVEFAMAMNCQANISSSLNNASAITIPTPNHCFCNLLTNNLISYELPGSGFLPNAQNSINFYAYGSEFGFNSTYPGFNGAFARVITYRKIPVTSVLWSTGATTDSLMLTTAGNYSVTFNDAAGCTYTKTRNFQYRAAPASPTITRSFGNTFCPPGTLTSSNAYAYQWSNGVTSQTNTINNTGIYNLTIIDVYGCKAYASDTIIQTAPGDSSVYGNNSWNVYVFNNGNFYIDENAWTGYSGYFTDNNLSFVSDNIYNLYNAPSTSPTYQGCPVNNQYYSWIAKRKGFACGLYSVTLAGHDDGAIVKMNGNTIYSQSYANNYFPALLYTGILDSTSTFEFKVSNGYGAGFGKLIITPISPVLNYTTTNICPGVTDKVTLTNNPALQIPEAYYHWSDGTNNDTLVVNNTQLVYLNIQSPACSISSDSVQFNLRAKPVITASDTGFLCNGTARNLTASSSSNYLWNNGATTQSISIYKRGNYSVSSFGCVSDTLKIAGSPNYSLSIKSDGPDTICPGYSVNYTAQLFDVDTFLIAPGNFQNVNPQPGCIYTYGSLFFNWTDQNLTTPDSVQLEYYQGYQGNYWNNMVNISLNNYYKTNYTSPYNYQCNGGNNPFIKLGFSGAGYTAGGTNTVSLNNFTIFGVIPFQGLSNTFVRVVVFRKINNMPYSWSTGETTASITSNSTGNYTVSFTDNFGCFRSASTSLLVRDMPKPVISRNFHQGYCFNGALTSSYATNYLWSTGESTQTISIYSAGIYSVTVSDAIGCSRSTTDTVPVGTPPTPLSYGNNIWNINTFNDYYLGNFAGYFTSSPINFVSDSLYSLQNGPSSVPGYQGCNVNNNDYSLQLMRKGFPCGLYALSLNGNGFSFYLNDELVLSTGGGGGVLWAGILDSTSRVKIETAVDPWSGPISIETILQPIPLHITPSSDTIVCSGSNKLISLEPTPSNPGNSYLWSNGATSANILINTVQSVSASVISSAGCTLQADTINYVLRNSPQITATSNGILCNGSSLTLQTNTVSNTWSNGSTTASITVNTPGQYSVTSNNCTSTYLVTKQPELKIVSNTNDTVCTGTNAIFSIPQATRDTFLIPISQLLTAATLCNDSVAAQTGGDFQINWNDTLPIKPSSVKIELAIAAECNGLTNYDTYLNNAYTGRMMRISTLCNTCQTPAAPVLSTYELDASNYRSGSNTFIIATGGMALTNSNPFFNGYYARVIVNRVTNIQSIVWNTGSNNDSITALSDSTYTAYVTRTNGCSDTLIRKITSRILTAPLISKIGIDSLCPNGGSLRSSYGPSYLWSTGATTQSITNRGPGMYTVTIADPGGCSATSSITIPAGNIPGNPQVFGNDSWNVYVFNQSSGAAIDVNNWLNNYSGYYTDTSTYLFNTENYWNGNGAPSSAIGYQGCSVSNEQHAWSAKRQGFPCGYYQVNVPAHDDAAQLFINGIKVFEHNGCCDNHTNVWSGMLNASSTIEFRVTEGGGFSNGRLQIVPISFAITADKNAICIQDSARLTPTLEINASALVSGGTIQWNNGSTNDTLYATNSGAYQLTISANGCSLTSNTLTLTQKNSYVPAPVITIDPSANVCDVDTVFLETGTYASYLWSNGNTTQQIGVTNSGSYQLTVTNDSGCVGSAAPQTVVMKLSLPQPAYLTPDTGWCNSTSITLSAAGLAPEKQVGVFSGSQRLRVAQDIPETNITIEFWFRTSESTTGIFSTTDQGSAHDRHIFLLNGVLHFRVWQAGTWNTSITGLNDNQWHHLAYTMSNSNGQRVYIDGVQRGAVGWGGTSNFTWQDRFSIGYSEDPGGAQRFFKGSLDNFRIWNYVRNANEIRANYQQQIPDTTTGLIYALNFNGNVIPQNGNTGIVNGLTYTVQDLYQFQWTGANAPSASGNSDWLATLSPGDNTFSVLISSAKSCPFQKTIHAYSGYGGVGTVSVNDTLICVGDTALPLLIRSGSSAPIQWEVMLPGETTWTSTDESGDTLSVGAPPEIQDTGFYQLRVVATSNTYGCDSISNIISFRVVDCNPAAIVLNLKLYLQGFYIGNGLMTPALFNAGMSQDMSLCDTIFVDFADPFSPSTIHYSIPALLHTDGTAQLLLPTALQGQSFYLVIRHRNSLSTYSKIPVTFSGNTITYDFSTP